MKTLNQRILDLLPKEMKSYNLGEPVEDARSEVYNQALDDVITALSAHDICIIPSGIDIAKVAHYASYKQYSPYEKKAMAEHWDNSSVKTKRRYTVVAQARKWFGIEPDYNDVNTFISHASFMGKCSHCKLDDNRHGWIKTLEGGHIVCPGDWIITGVNGEKYPCKPDIFDTTYELVKD